MSGFLLDTNHLGVALSIRSPTYKRILAARQQGVRIGTCMPVICELAVGIAQSNRRDQNWRSLDACLRQIKVWPLDIHVARHYAEIYQELRSKGRILSQVDMMIAAMARHAGLTILTTDRDFEALPDIRTENWLSS